MGSPQAGIDTKQGTGEAEGLVEAFVRRNNYPFSVLLDSGGGAAQRFPVFGIPTALLIDKGGRAVFRSLGITTGIQKKYMRPWTRLLGVNIRPDTCPR